MDKSEELVEQYLKGEGFTNIVYEPAGNVPPDFLVDGHIAVEVRRLNQNFDDGTNVWGLEEHEIPLWKNVLRYLGELNTNIHEDQSWFVWFDFKRPIPPWRVLHRELDRTLKSFVTSSNRQAFNTELTTNFRLEVFPSSLVDRPFFIPGGYQDNDAGGWVLHEIWKNLQLCITEKAQKISRHRNKYPEWWLVLPIHMLFDRSDFEELLQLEDFTLNVASFDKIVILDQQDGLRSFQCHPK